MRSVMKNVVWPRLAMLIPLMLLVKLGEKRILIEEFYYSMKAYLMLYRGGFRVSVSTSKDVIRWDLFRFWWKGTIIKDAPDISGIDGHWNTTRDGHVEELK